MLVPLFSIDSHCERQANRLPPGSPAFARQGFSLIELLIVIGILTVVTAFVLPAVRGPLDRSRLRSAAIDLQKAWGTARTLAIREGMAMNFRCESGGRHWKIERSGQTVQVSSATDAGGTPSGLRADAEPDGGSALLSDTGTSSRLVREGWLPEGVTFADLSVRPKVLPRHRTAEIASDQESGRAVVGPHWSEPLRFRPEGRSQDARLRISGADGFVIDITIRGLTSSVSFTAPSRRQRAVSDSGGRL